MIFLLYYFTFNVFMSACIFPRAHFIMRDRIIAQKEYLACLLFSSIFKRFDEAYRTTPATGIVNDRLEEAVRIEMLMKTATPIVE